MGGKRTHNVGRAMGLTWPYNVRREEKIKIIVSRLTPVLWYDTLLLPTRYIFIISRRNYRFCVWNFKFFLTELLVNGDRFFFYFPGITKVILFRDHCATLDVLLESRDFFCWKKKVNTRVFTREGCQRGFFMSRHTILNFFSFLKIGDPLYSVMKETLVLAHRKSALSHKTRPSQVLFREVLTWEKRCTLTLLGGRIHSWMCCWKAVLMIDGTLLVIWDLSEPWTGFSRRSQHRRPARWTLSQGSRLWKGARQFPRCWQRKVFVTPYCHAASAKRDKPTIQCARLKLHYTILFLVINRQITLHFLVPEKIINFYITRSSHCSFFLHYTIRLNTCKYEHFQLTFFQGQGRNGTQVASSLWPVRENYICRPVQN